MKRHIIIILVIAIFGLYLIPAVAGLITFLPYVNNFTDAIGILIAILQTICIYLVIITRKKI